MFILNIPLYDFDKILLIINCILNNSIKKTEIEAIKDNEATINQLKIDKLKAEFENEVSKLNNNIVSLEKDIELKESELKSLNNVISSKDLEIKTLIKENKQSKKLK